MKIVSASFQAKGHDVIVRSREGRMRYAPTPVRSILGKLRSLGVKEYPQIEKYFAKNCRGVSHTPSTAAKMKIVSASIQAKGDDGVVRSREGRMRYAPTYLPIVRREAQ